LKRIALAALLAATCWTAAPAQGRAGATPERYDHLFKKYSKRYFGPAYDWRVFRAQALAESNLSPEAHSKVGARGIMQLMPSTFRQIQSANADFKSLDDPEWNIAAGICYDRTLWQLWTDHPTLDDRRDFMFASYNAGRGTLLRAQNAARARQLEVGSWKCIAQIAPEVRGWRYRETLDYVEKIRAYVSGLEAAPPP